MKKHAIKQWHIPTYILDGSQNELRDPKIFNVFVEKFPCKVEIAPHTVHYFHTPEEKTALRDGLEKLL